MSEEGLDARGSGGLERLIVKVDATQPYRSAAPTQDRLSDVPVLEQVEMTVIGDEGSTSFCVIAFSLIEGGYCGMLGFQVPAENAEDLSAEMVRPDCVGPRLAGAPRPLAGTGSSEGARPLFNRP